MTDNSSIIEQRMQALKKQMATLPRIIGNEVVNFSLDNFKRQAFLGNTVEPWPPRRGKQKKSRRAILIKTGRLRRGTRVIQANWDAVVVGNDVPYAKAHNEGYNGSVTIKAHQRKKFTKQRVGKGIYSVKTRKEKMKTVATVSGSIAVKSHTRRMNIKRRRFLGKSPYLLARLQRIAVSHILKAYR